MVMLLNSRRLGPAWPQMPVEIDWKHPMAEGLLFYQFGDRDLVSGGIAVPVSSWGASTSGRNHGRNGLAMESHATTNGGFEFAGTDIARLQGTRFMTMISLAEVDSAASYGCLLAAAWDRADPWDVPFFSIRLTRDTATSSLRIGFAESVSTLRHSNSSTGVFLTTGALRMYGGTKNDTTTAEFFSDGVLHSANTGTNMNLAIQINDTSVFVGSRNASGGGEGVNGRIPLSAIWAREFERTDHAAFYANPYALLRPRVPRLYHFPDTPSGPLDNNRISSMHFQRHYEPIAVGT